MAQAAPSTPLAPAQKVRLQELLHWIFAPLSFMEKYAAEEGPIFRKAIAVGAAQPNIWFVSDPDALQTILSQDTTVFDAPGEANGLLRPIVGDRSMILLSDQEHRRSRKLLMPPFHGERMRQYGDTIVAIARSAVDALGPNQRFIARQQMQDVTLQVILDVVFGLRPGDRQAQMKPLIAAILDMVGSPLRSSLLFFKQFQRPLGPWRNFLRDRAALDELIYAEIRDRRAQPPGDDQDILSLLLSARDEDGNPMDDQELRDELITLLVAGHETTASAIAWAFYWIHQNEHIRTTLLAELDTLPPDPDPMDLFRLPYLTAICNETLRIYPIGMLTFPRRVRQPVRLANQTLEPGELVMGSIYLAHRNPNVFPNPTEFCPDRFLKRQYSPYEFLPFGGGSRRCLGLALAQYEMKLVLGTWLRHWTFELTEPGPVPPQRRGLTLGPKTGVRMRTVAPRTP